MALHTTSSARWRRQHGAFGIVVAGTLALLIVLLGLVVDSGRLYMEQRRLQKVADMAALESIARLPNGDCAANPDDAQSFAVQNAQQNGFALTQQRTLQAVCVRLKIENNRREGVPDPSGNAVQVSASNRVAASVVSRIFAIFDPAFPDHTNLRATAIAERQQPAAAFSVGSQLLNLDEDGFTGRLLTSVGLDPGRLTVLDSDGLANASVTPAGLLHALGIDLGIQQLKALSPQGLLDLMETEVGALGMDRLIALSLEAVSDNVLKTQLEALSEDILSSHLSDVQLQLFATAESPGLLSIDSDSDTVDAALDTQINVGDLLKTALMIGANGRAVQIPELNLLGLATVQLGIVEPPSIGIGPVGTTAYTAQIRLLVDIDTDKGYLVGSALNLLGARIKIPLIIDLVGAKATLTQANCQASPPWATIDVESRIGSACIGRMPAGTLWSTRASCTENIASENLMTLLGKNIAVGHVALPILETPPEELVLELGGAPQWTHPNNLELGTLVADLTTELLALVEAGGGNDAQELNLQDSAEEIVDRYLALPSLQPTDSNGRYSTGNLNAIRDRLESDGFNWDRPGGLLGLGTRSVMEEWRNSRVCSTRQPACVRQTLIESLQTQAQGGLLGGLLGALLGPVLNLVTGILGGVVTPLLASVLAPLLDLLEPTLNSVGNLLDDGLLDPLGLELGRSEVKLHDLSCGSPTLVR